MSDCLGSFCYFSDPPDQCERLVAALEFCCASADVTGYDQERNSSSTSGDFGAACCEKGVLYRNAHELTELLLLDKLHFLLQKFAEFNERLEIINAYFRIPCCESLNRSAAQRVDDIINLFMDTLALHNLLCNRQSVDHPVSPIAVIECGEKFFALRVSHETVLMTTISNNFALHTLSTTDDVFFAQGLRTILLKEVVDQTALSLVWMFADSLSPVDLASSSCDGFSSLVLIQAVEDTKKAFDVRNITNLREELSATVNGIAINVQNMVTESLEDELTKCVELAPKVSVELGQISESILSTKLVVEQPQSLVVERKDTFRKDQLSESLVSSLLQSVEDEDVFAYAARAYNSIREKAFQLPLTLDDREDGLCSGNGTEGSCSTDSSLSAKPGQGLVSYGEDVVVQSRTVANVVDQEIQLLQSSNTVFLKAEQDSQSSKSEKDKVIPGEPTDYFLEEVGNDTNQLIHNLESLPPRAQVWTKSSENCATIPKIINDYKGKSLYDSDVALNTSDYVETENVIEDSVKNIFAPEGKDADRLQENLLVQTLNDEPVEQLNQQEDSTVYLVETVKPCAALYTDVGSDIAHKAVKSADFQLVELEPLSIPTGVLSSVESKHMLPSCEKQSQNNVSKADQIPVISESPKEPSLLEVEIRQDHVGSIPIVLSGEEVIADQTCSLSPNVHPVEPNDRNKSLISDGPLMDATREHKESEIAYRSKKESYDKFVLPMNLGLAVASTAEFQGSDYVPADASPRNPGYESKVKIEQDAVEIEIDLDKERDEQMQSSVADGQAIQENFEVLSKSVSAVERISFHDSTPSDGGHELGLGLGLGNEQSTLAFEESKFQIASDGRNFVSQPLISSPTAEGFSKHLANYKFPSIKQGLVEDLHADKETNIKSSLTNTNQINAEKLVQISQAVQMPTKQYLYDSKLSDKLRGIRMIIDYQFYLESMRQNRSRISMGKEALRFFLKSKKQEMNIPQCTLPDQDTQLINSIYIFENDDNRNGEGYEGNNAVSYEIPIEDNFVANEPGSAHREIGDASRSLYLEEKASEVVVTDFEQAKTRSHDSALETVFSSVVDPYDPSSAEIEFCEVELNDRKIYYDQTNNNPQLKRGDQFKGHAAERFTTAAGLSSEEIGILNSIAATAAAYKNAQPSPRAAIFPTSSDKDVLKAEGILERGSIPVIAPLKTNTLINHRPIDERPRPTSRSRGNRGKFTSKLSNFLQIKNAVTHVCLAGKKSEIERIAALQVLDYCQNGKQLTGYEDLAWVIEFPVHQFIISFYRHKAVSFRGIYAVDQRTNSLRKVYGKGPLQLSLLTPKESGEEMAIPRLSSVVVEYLKFETSSKTFQPIPVKDVSNAVDAVVLDPIKIKGLSRK